MSYLHCHSCGWEQDDFWDLFVYYKWRKKWWKRLCFGYNPIRNVWYSVKWLWKPRWISLDEWIINDIQKYTNRKAKIRILNRSLAHNNRIIEYKEHQVFSWSWLIIEIVKEWKKFRNQRWWTWKSWQKAKDTAVCPKCGSRNFDID